MVNCRIVKLHGKLQNCEVTWQTAELWSYMANCRTVNLQVKLRNCEVTSQSAELWSYKSICRIVKLHGKLQNYEITWQNREFWNKKWNTHVFCYVHRCKAFTCLKSLETLTAENLFWKRTYKFGNIISE